MAKTSMIKFSKASLEDAKGIRDLILTYAKEEKMLSRSLSSIYERLRDFYVAKSGSKVIGVCALHVVWEDIAEIRSLAVSPDFTGQGVGKKLMAACLAEAKKMGFKKVFTLTLVPKFFNKFGFKKIDSEKLPMKVWGECKNCPKFMNCDEVPLMLEF